MDPAVGTWRRHPAALSREVPEGWLVLGAGDGPPALLAGSAATVWHLLARPSTLARLVDELLDRYTGDAPEIAAGVEQALAELAAIGLVEKVAAP